MDVIADWAAARAEEATRGIDEAEWGAERGAHGPDLDATLPDEDLASNVDRDSWTTEQSHDAAESLSSTCSFIVEPRGRCTSQRRGARDEGKAEAAVAEDENEAAVADQMFLQAAGQMVVAWHGGGRTSVVQTCDTDLVQAASPPPPPQHQKSPPPKGPFVKGRGRVAFTLRQDGQASTTPSPRPSPPPPPKGVAAVAVRSHASSAPTAPTRDAHI